MPGITGVIKKQSSGNEESKLDAMLDIMLHESFYTSCRFNNDELKAYIGHTALEGSFSDCMPIFNEKKDLVMFLAGECYEDKEVIAHLSSKGHKFNPDNASYLIHYYEEHGNEFFTKLNGWFSGVILDLQQSKVIIFNDRYGMQRIYYYQNEDAFYFSSEAKSLLKAFPHLRQIDLQSIGEYFCLDCAINNKTFFSNISLMPAGSIWTFTNGELERKKYFEPSILEKLPFMEKAQFYEELGDKFTQILPRYLSGKSIGMALTGGLDTKMILACLENEQLELPCFTYGGRYQDSMDIRIARQVAKACKQNHEVIRLDDNYLAEYANNIERGIFLTDGLSDSLSSDEVYLSNIARQIAPVKITGKFGSQVLRGVNALKINEPNKQLIAHDFNEYILSAIDNFSEIKKGHSLSFFLYNEIPWYFSRFTAPEYSQFTPRSPYLDNDFINLLYRAPNGGIIGSEFQLYLIAKNSPKLYRIMTNRGLGGPASKLASIPQKLLYKFLYGLGTLASHSNLPYSLHHWVARFDFSQISRMIIGYDKFRFYRLWFQKELSSYLHEILMEKRTLERPYWNKKYIKKIVHGHKKGYGNYTIELNKILTIELIHRVLVEDI